MTIADNSRPSSEKKYIAADCQIVTMQPSDKKLAKYELSHGRRRLAFLISSTNFD